MRRLTVLSTSPPTLLPPPPPPLHSLFQNNSPLQECPKHPFTHNCVTRKLKLRLPSIFNGISLKRRHSGPNFCRCLTRLKYKSLNGDWTTLCGHLTEVPAKEGSIVLTQSNDSMIFLICYIALRIPVDYDYKFFFLSVLPIQRRR